jgi:hypothetical protein
MRHLEGPLMERAITEIGQRKEGYFKTLPIDCNTDDKDLIKSFPYCETKIRSQLPALMFSEPALNSFNPETGETVEPKNHQYQGQLQE